MKKLNTLFPDDPKKLAIRKVIKVMTSTTITYIPILDCGHWGPKADNTNNIKDSYPCKTCRELMIKVDNEARRSIRKGKK